MTRQRPSDTSPTTTGPSEEPDDLRGTAAPAFAASAEEAPSKDALPFSGEMLRKVLHLAALAIPAGMVLLDRTNALWLFTTLALGALAADVVRAREPRFGRWIRRVFGGMMRPEEWPEPGALPVLNGATCVLVSAALLTWIFPVALGAAVLATFMIADAAAALIGIRFGRRRWPGTRRTVEGSLAFAVTAFPCLLVFGHVSAGAAVVATLAGTAAEVPEWRVNDNVRVPLVMAAVLFGWGL